MLGKSQYNWLRTKGEGSATWTVRKITGTSLVAQWLRIRLPMQGTWVQSLVWEDPTRYRATKPVSHN